MLLTEGMEVVMATQQRRRRATSLLGAALLACLGAREALGLGLGLQQTLVLPTEGEFHIPQSLSLLAGSDVVLVTAKRGRKPGQTGDQEASWVAWKVAGAGGNAQRIVPSSIGENIEGCVLQTSTKALCTVISASGDFRVLILQLDDGTVAQRKSIKSLPAVTVRGMERTAGGDVLVWGVSALHPFAALIDENAGVKWSFSWPEFGVGEFYDGMVTPAGVRLLAIPRREDGSTGNDISAVELSPLGKLVGSRTFPRASRATLPLLSGSGRIAPGAVGGEASEPLPVVMLETAALPAEPGLLKWARPDPDTLAYISMEGTSAVLLVKKGEGAEAARAPVAGFPVPALVAGNGHTIDVLTTDVERTNPPRQILRLSRFTLSRQ
jgi:hypothetical protein